MDRRTARRFSREFKLSALARMESGDNVSALSRDLDVRRKLLYEWRDASAPRPRLVLRMAARTP